MELDRWSPDNAAHILRPGPRLFNIDRSVARPGDQPRLWTMRLPRGPFPVNSLKEQQR